MSSIKKLPPFTNASVLFAIYNSSPFYL